MYTLLITYFCLAFFLSFVCSLLEAVLLSTPSSYPSILKKEDSKSGFILERFKDNINRPLAAILTLNTFSHTIGAAGVGSQVLKIFGEAYVAIASGVLTFLILALIIFLTMTIIHFGLCDWSNFKISKYKYSVTLTYGMTVIFGIIYFNEDQSFRIFEYQESTLPLIYDVELSTA